MSKPETEPDKSRPADPRCEQIGGLMRLARRRHGLSLEKIGKIMGKSKGYLSEIERGKKWCRFDTFLDFRDALGLPASAVLDDTNPELIAGLTAVQSAVGEALLHQFSDMAPTEIKLFFDRGSEAVDARRYRRRCLPR